MKSIDRKFKKFVVWLGVFYSSLSITLLWMIIIALAFGNAPWVIYGSIVVFLLTNVYLFSCIEGFKRELENE